MQFKKILTSAFLSFFLIISCSHEVADSKAFVEKYARFQPASWLPDKETRSKVFRIDTLFQQLNKAKLFNGNVLVAQKGLILYQKSFGMANFTENIALHDSSRFQLASVSKTITASAVLKLVESNKINLSDEVSQHLSGFPYAGVKIEHLITHRSGLPNYLYFCSPYLKDAALEKLTNQQVFDVITRVKPTAYTKPGRRFNYSNTNYMLLALLIEKVSGMTYKDFVKKEIFIPLHMDNSCFIDELDSVAGHYKTLGYTNRLKEVGYDAFDFVLGDKGVYSTTTDLLRFSEAFFSGKLISLNYLTLAVQPYSPEKKQSNYGYGWRMKFCNTDDKLVFHNGWWHGYRTALQRRLRDSTTVIILSNKLNSSVYQTYKIFEALDGAEANQCQQPEEESE